MTSNSKPLRRWAGRLALLNLVIVAVVVAWFFTAADENAYATLLLFGPRWLALAPLALLLPFTLLTRSWSGVVCGLLAAIVIAGPFMGGTLNFAPELMPLPPQGNNRVRILTFNADAKATNRAQFQKFLDEYHPDVVCLQESGQILPEDFPPHYVLSIAGNGLKFASKFPFTMVGSLSDPKIGPARGAARFRVTLPTLEFEMATVHLPTPRHGLEAVLSRQPNAMEKLEAVIAQRSAASAVVREWVTDCSIVAGDFNLPVESTIYRRDWGQYQNAYSEAGLGWGWTMFSRRGSVRIDQILCKPQWKCQSVMVGPDLGSAHRPLLADLTQ